MKAYILALSGTVSVPLPYVIVICQTLSSGVKRRICNSRRIGGSPTSLEMTVDEGLTSGSVPVVVESANTAQPAMLSRISKAFYYASATPRTLRHYVVANGFKTVHQNGVMLEADQKAQPDFARTLDALNQTTAAQ
jgi:hypothetical protein